MKCTVFQSIGNRPSQQDTICVNGETFQSNNLHTIRTLPKQAILSITDGFGEVGVCEKFSLETAKRSFQILSSLIDIDTSTGDTFRTIQQELLSNYPSTCGAAFAALIFTDIHVHVFSAGDCKVFSHSSQMLNKITNDHTAAHHLVASGIITQEESESHIMQSYLEFGFGYTFKNRWESTNVDHFSLEIGPENKFIIASDGLLKGLNYKQLSTLLCNCHYENKTELDFFLQGTIFEDNTTFAIIDL